MPRTMVKMQRDCQMLAVGYLNSARVFAINEQHQQFRKGVILGSKGHHGSEPDRLPCREQRRWPRDWPWFVRVACMHLIASYGPELQQPNRQIFLGAYKRANPIGRSNMTPLDRGMAAVTDRTKAKGRAPSGCFL